MPEALRRIPASITLLVALAVLALLAASCSHDGRTLAEPDPDLTATTPPTTIAAATSAPVMSLGSRAFAAEGALPARFTCTGGDVSPPLSFTDLPNGTQSLTVALTDPDAGGYVHWVATGIDPNTVNLAADAVPAEAVVYANDFGHARYEGPCPPEGETHRYVFTLYAMPPSAATLLPPDETNGAAVLLAQAGLASSTATLAATYEGPAS